MIEPRAAHVPSMTRDDWAEEGVYEAPSSITRHVSASTWPVNSPLGWHNPEPKTKKAQRRKALREGGAEEVHDGFTGWSRDGRRVYPDSQYSREDLEIMDDPDATPSERLSVTRRVWEPVPATPLILDFTDVKEPLFPGKTHPSLSGSQHPDRPLYAEVMKLARNTYPERALRDAYYWVRMDKGELPGDFNPYPPNTDRHEAFKQRVCLHDDRMTDENNHLMTRRQVSRRARRKVAKGGRLTDAEFHTIYKPIEEWDIEELAKGYPKLAETGYFPSKPPSEGMQAEIRERIDKLFKEKVRDSMRGSTVTALRVIQRVMEDDEVDHRGRPVVTANAKLDAAKFLVEHLLGKPKQVVEEDISVKLAGILGSVMVSPETVMGPASVQSTGRLLAAQRGSRQGHDDTALKALEGYVDAEFWEEDDE